MTVATGNEVQTVTIGGSPTGGTFTLTYSGQTTAAIAYNASAATVKSRLEALSNIGAGNVDVTGSNGGPWTVTFKGTLQDTDVAQMTANAGSLTGGTSPSVTPATSSGGNPSADEIVYVDISVANGLVANLEVLPGQTPPPGHARVSKHDYYAG